MTTVEKKLDLLCRMIMGPTEEDRNAARRNLNKLMDQLPQHNADEMIHELLAEIGVPSGNVGHAYLVEFIKETVSNPYFTNSMCEAYGTVAKRFNSTASRVERGVRHSIEVAWLRGDSEIIEKYFKNTVHADRGRPTNTEFIARMANIVRLRLNS